MTQATEARGLENVVAATTAVADVDGTAGTLRYCGYDIHELIDRYSFEAIAWLLWNGELPTSGELDTFSRELRARRLLSATALHILRQLPQATLPIDAVRTVVSAIAADDILLERGDSEAVRAV